MPRPYSTGTSARKRRNWPARRSSSSGASGAARKPSSASSIAARASADAAASPRAAARASAANSAAACRASAAPRWSANDCLEDGEVARGPTRFRRRAREAKPRFAASSTPSSAMRRRAWYVSRRSVRTAAAACGGVDAPFAERVEREGRVRARPREARRRPELPHEQPAPRLLDVAGLEGGEDAPVGAAEHGRLDARRRAAARRDGVAGLDRRLDLPEAPPRSPCRGRSACEPGRRSLGLAERVVRGGGLAEDQRPLGVGELDAQVGGRLPGRLAGRSRGRRMGKRGERRDGERRRERRDAARGYCSISTPSCAAA